MGQLFKILPNNGLYLMKAIVTHRQQVQEMQEQLQESELTFRLQVT